MHRCGDASTTNRRELIRWGSGPETSNSGTRNPHHNGIPIDRVLPSSARYGRYLGHVHPWRQVLEDSAMSGQSRRTPQCGLPARDPGRPPLNVRQFPYRRGTCVTPISRRGRCLLHDVDV